MLMLLEGTKRLISPISACSEGEMSTPAMPALGCSSYRLGELEDLGVNEISQHLHINNRAYRLVIGVNRN